MGLPLGITPGDIIEVLVLIIAGAGVVWSVRFEVRVMRHDLKNISQEQITLESAISELKKEMGLQFDQVERELGETIAAMREKVTQVELYMRDNFVRKETFSQVLSEIRGSILRIEDRDKKRGA